jgi:HK97 family phage portal protein
MDWKKLKFWDKKAQEIETKTTSREITWDDFACVLGYGYGLNYRYQWLTIPCAWNYYANVSCVYNAVDKIAKGFSAVFPDIWDTQERRFLSEKEVSKLPINQIITLLENPSDDITTPFFLYSLPTSFTVTGDIFLLGKAVTKESKFMSVEYVNPSDIEVYADKNTIGVGYYQMKRGNGLVKFYPEQTKTGTRYYSDNGANVWELYHIYNFNPRRSQRNTGCELRGMSPLNPIYIEIEQHIEGNYNNLSTQKNGMRPSGVMEVGPQLDSTQRDYLKKQIQEHARQDGTVLILDGLSPGEDGLQVKFNQMSINNKDMDFANLLRMDKRQIYNNLGMPLPLVEGETQTYSNYQHAEAILYTSEVIPFANIFYPELTRFLMPRYDKNNNGRYILAINPKNIPSLETVNVENVKTKISTGVLTDNEGREELGLQPHENGNQIYKPQNLIPVGTVQEAKNIAADRLFEVMALSGYNQGEIEAKKQELNNGNS